jgi:hypothetical protein
MTGNHPTSAGAGALGQWLLRGIGCQLPTSGEGPLCTREPPLHLAARGGARAPIPAVRRGAVAPVEFDRCTETEVAFASSWLRRILRQRRCSGQGQVRRNAVELDPKRNAGHL